MWVFSKYGFYSVVCKRDKTGQVDVNSVAIRARRREHLEALQERFPALNESIEQTPRRDYRYRIATSRAIWADILGQLAQEIDYDNFKAKIAEVSGNDPYERALHSVWEVMYGIQE